VAESPLVLTTALSSVFLRLLDINLCRSMKEWSYNLPPKTIRATRLTVSAKSLILSIRRSLPPAANQKLHTATLDINTAFSSRFQSDTDRERSTARAKTVPFGEGSR
jgi:hypothetical protein